MTKLLPTYLKLATAGPHEYKQTVEHKISKELTAYNEKGEVVRVKELLLAEAIESSTLIQTEMYRTFLEGAEPEKVARNCMEVLPMKSNVMTVTYGETGTYAAQVAEGAEIPINVQDYNVYTLTSVKYGDRPLITNEMVEDGMFNVVELEVRKSGAKLENALNQEALSTLMQGSGNEVDCGNSGATPLLHLGEAIGMIKDDGYKPDTIILHPQFEGDVISQMIPTSTVVGDQQIMRTGQIGRIYGCDVYGWNGADNSSSYIWDFDTDGDLGALMYQKAYAGAIGMRRDLTVKNYDDPIRDLVGMSCTMRFDALTFFANATCRVIY